MSSKEHRFLIHMWKQGRHLLRWMSNRYTMKPALGTSTHASCEIPQLAHQYLLHQADALHFSKMSMEKAGLQSSIHGLTPWHSALCMQIFGCLGRQFRELLGCAKTFTWDQGTYQVSRCLQPLLPNICQDLSGKTPDDESWIKDGKLLYKLKK